MKKGWVKSKFGDVCQYRKDNGVHKNLQYVGMEHIGQGNGLLLGTIDSNSVLSTSFRFQKGDVLYGRLRPYLKKACVAEFEGCCSTEIFPIFSGVCYNISKWSTRLHIRSIPMKKNKLISDFDNSNDKILKNEYN